MKHNTTSTFCDSVNVKGDQLFYRRAKISNTSQTEIITPGSEVNSTSCTQNNEIYVTLAATTTENMS